MVRDGHYIIWMSRIILRNMYFLNCLHMIAMATELPMTPHPVPVSAQCAVWPPCPLSVFPNPNLDVAARGQMKCQSLLVSHSWSLCYRLFTLRPTSGFVLSRIYVVTVLPTAACIFRFIIFTLHQLHCYVSEFTW